MSTKSLINSYFTSPGVLSQDPIRVGLQRELEAHQRSAARLQAIQFGIIFVLIIGALVALAFDLVGGANVRIALLAAAGLSVPALLTQLRQSTKEWSEATLFLILVRNSDEQEARDLLKRYAAKAS